MTLQTKRNIKNKLFVDEILNSHYLDNINFNSNEDQKLIFLENGKKWTINKEFLNGSLMEIILRVSNIEYLNNLKIKPSTKEYKIKRINRSCWIYKAEGEQIFKSDIKINDLIFRGIDLINKS